MRRLVFFGVAIALLLIAMPAMAGFETCTDISEQCLTTPEEMCTDAFGNSVTVQIGGPDAEDSNGDDGTCEFTKAVALVTFTKVSDTELKVKIDNRTCNDNGSLTALFHNITHIPQTVTAYTPVLPFPSSVVGVEETNWEAGYDQTCLPPDPSDPTTCVLPCCMTGAGFKADGFGSFDASIHNGDNLNPNGGNKLDIRAGEIFEFTLDVQPGFDLCDFLTEISTPPPGDRNRNIVGRWKACGPQEENSAYIGPCTPDGELLAVIDGIRLLPGDRNMRVEWSTSLEIQNAGFNVLRREATHGGWERVNANLLPGQGDTVSGAEYVFVDDTALNGVEYMYRIEDIDFSGRNDLSEIRRDVTNPSNPRVNLTHPAYGATVDLSNRPRFAFASHGSFSPLIMQISADPTFADGSIVSTHVPRRFGSSEVTLSRRTARLVTAAARDNEGIVYWRLVDRDRDPLSDTFRIEIQDIEGSRAGQFSRVGMNR